MPSVQVQIFITNFTLKVFLGFLLSAEAKGKHMYGKKHQYLLLSVGEYAVNA